MITVQQAENLIFERNLRLNTELVPLPEANRRLACEDIRADRDFPPFNRVTMDGVAINMEGWNQGRREFHIAGVQAAGEFPKTLTDSQQCLEVMTGAVLPQGADTVIPYEHLQKAANGSVQITVDPRPGQNVHRQGSDRRAGEVIIKSGTLMEPPEIGIAATVGKSELVVRELPKIAIISTGNELVEVHESPLPHQIRSSNAHTMEQALARWKIQAQRYHLIDDLQGTIAKLGELINSYQVLILSGGVSKGKFDHVPQALEQLQVDKHFHRISQRPGKPFWFGSHPSGCLVFAFPGNPVSAFMCFNRYFKPWMDQQLAFRTSNFMAELQTDINFKPDLTYFAQVKVESLQEKIIAWPAEGHGSGDLANLVKADGFLELPKGQDTFAAFSRYPLYLYRDL
ncbi:MAG: molybdopterin molybdotransferase MoeA [Cyclobacteriaceae bacterium]|nr:molybdopterin molybdotransferase MoeA [Cyclobacteriaceae bacterium]